MEADSVVTILGMALVTYATRAGGLCLMGSKAPSPGFERWHRHIPGAVFISMLAPMVAAGDTAELLALVATIAVGVSTGNVSLTMLTGVGAVWALRHIV